MPPMMTSQGSPMDYAALAEGAAALLRDAGAEDAGLRDAILQTLALADSTFGSEGGGDLGLGDVYRIRLLKLAARRLPPETWRDLATRRRLRSGIRALVETSLGGDLPPSPFLD